MIIIKHYYLLEQAIEVSSNGKLYYIVKWWHSSISNGKLCKCSIINYFDVTEKLCKCSKINYFDVPEKLCKCSKINYFDVTEKLCKCFTVGYFT